MNYLLFVFYFLSFGLLSQTDTLKYSFNNSINGSTASNTNQTNFLYLGDNSFKYKKFALNNNSNYSISWISKKIAEDFTHKTNFSYKNWFCLYMFNHSLTRSIQYDNSIGVGYIYWWKYFSLSYGVIYENTVFSILPNVSVYRNSLRAKFKYDARLLNISFEYYYQPNFKVLTDYIFYGITKVTLFQNHKIGISFTDNINYRSFSTTKMIHSLSVGLNLILSNDLKK